MEHTPASFFNPFDCSSQRQIHRGRHRTDLKNGAIWAGLAANACSNCCHTDFFRASADASLYLVAGWKDHVARFEITQHHRAIPWTKAPVHSDEQTQHGIQPVLISFGRESTVAFCCTPVSSLIYSERSKLGSGGICDFLPVFQPKGLLPTRVVAWTGQAVEKLGVE